MVKTYGGKKSTSGRKRVYPRNRATRKNSFDKRVESIINKNMENKEAFHTLSGNFNSQINTGSGSEIMQVIPNIAQSTADNGRIGDQIRAQRLEIGGFISMNLTYTTAASSRIAVRLMMVQPKSLGLLSNIQNNTNSWLNSLIKKGGTTTFFAGNADDLYAPINTDAVTKYYDKVFYLNLPYMNTAVGETSTVGSTKLIRISKSMRNKLLKYDSTFSALSPVDYNPVLLLGYVHMDGSIGDTINTQAHFSYSSRLQYQDA